jgi:DNA-binding Lrp family transcriptional regulator
MKLTNALKSVLRLIEEKNVTKTSEFAKILNISPAGVHGHIEKMRKGRAIKKSYLVDYSVFGLIPVMFMLEFFRPIEDGFVEELGNHGDVKKLVKVGGDFDYMVLAVFENEERMRHFLTSVLAHNDKVRSFKTVMLERGVHV